jgi:hypothetical protein
LMNHGHEGNHYYDTMEIDDETWEQCVLRPSSSLSRLLPLLLKERELIEILGGERTDGKPRKNNTTTALSKSCGTSLGRRGRCLGSETTSSRETTRRSSGASSRVYSTVSRRNRYAFLPLSPPFLLSSHFRRLTCPPPSSGNSSSPTPVTSATPGSAAKLPVVVALPLHLPLLSNNDHRMGTDTLITTSSSSSNNTLLRRR